MTVRIVDEGPDKSVVKQIVCRACGCTLEYVPNDIRNRGWKDIDGGSAGMAYIVCLKCNKEVRIRSW